METAAHFPGSRCGGLYSMSPSLLPLPPPPPATNWQNPLKCSLDADITMKNLQRTRMPHPENGPLDLSPCSQSASPSPYPHSATFSRLPSSPPPFPMRRTNLGSSFHAQGGARVGYGGHSLFILTMNQNIAREEDEDHASAALS